MFEGIQLEARPTEAPPTGDSGETSQAYFFRSLAQLVVTGETVIRGTTIGEEVSYDYGEEGVGRGLIVQVDETLYGEPVSDEIDIEFGEYWKMPSGEAVATDAFPWVESSGVEFVAVLREKRVPDELKMTDLDTWATIANEALFIFDDGSISAFDGVNTPVGKRLNGVSIEDFESTLAGAIETAEQGGVEPASDI